MDISVERAAFAQAQQVLRNQAFAVKETSGRIDLAQRAILMPSTEKSPKLTGWGFAIPPRGRRVPLLPNARFAL